MPVTAIDLREIDKYASNVYEAIIVAGRRARQINEQMKLQYNQMSSTLDPMNTDDDSEDFNNPDQVKISLEFEKQPKPHIQALNQLLEGKLKYEFKK